MRALSGTMKYVKETSEAPQIGWELARDSSWRHGLSSWLSHASNESEDASDDAPTQQG